MPDTRIANEHSQQYVGGDHPKDRVPPHAPSLLTPLTPRRRASSAPLGFAPTLARAPPPNTIASRSPTSKSTTSPSPTPTGSPTSSLLNHYYGPTPHNLRRPHEQRSDRPRRKRTREPDAVVKQYLGTSPFDWVGDEGLGLGIAMYDLMGQAAVVPVYKLFGQRYRTSTAAVP
ncbi:MAG: hypothetical protein U0992_08120 [Planctomycetaceae bacterium]